MKKALLFLLTVLLATGVKAQSGSTGLWAPTIGTKWVYSGYSLGGPFQVKLTYAADTVIAGQTSQVLRLGDSPYLRIYTRATADQVFVYSGGQWYKLYDFSALPGTSWTTLDAFLTVGCPRAVTVTVDSVGQRVVGGQMRRWFKASYQIAFPGGSPPVNNTWGRVYEGIGPFSGFLNIATGSSFGCPVLEDFIGPLLCFSPDGQANVYSNNAFTSVHCNAALASTPPLRFPAELPVFPNPSTGKVTLALPARYAAAAVEAHDHTGRLIWSGNLPANQQLDLSHLPKGIFMLRVKQANQPVLTRRVVLQ